VGVHVWVGYWVWCGVWVGGPTLARMNFFLLEGFHAYAAILRPARDGSCLWPFACGGFVCVSGEPGGVCWRAKQRNGRELLNQGTTDARWPATRRVRRLRISELLDDLSALGWMSDIVALYASSAGRGRIDMMLLLRVQPSTSKFLRRVTGRGLGAQRVNFSSGLDFSSWQSGRTKETGAPNSTAARVPLSPTCESCHFFALNWKSTRDSGIGQWTSAGGR
jgi:hypothetical protein